MNLDTYTPAATATAEPRAYDLEYLLPGIIGEVGELFSEFAKQHWHETDRSATIVDEYGDIAWLTAVLLSNYSIGEAELEYVTKRYGSQSSVLDHEGALELILARASSVYRSIPSQLPMRAAMLWSSLSDQSETLTGTSFSDVLQGNIAKLAERSANGELKTHA